MVKYWCNGRYNNVDYAYKVIIDLIREWNQGKLINWDFNYN